ncbi:MAG TPA: hypothetical protein VK540_15880 [Polyangiaceae bacterium]|jgi:hypothetical protein|nr:hypothetical protein [Polyangiaceae bacterium]
MERVLFNVPVGLGLTREIDRAMHAVSAIPAGDGASSADVRESLVIASRRWDEVAARMRALAESMSPTPRRRQRH